MKSLTKDNEAGRLIQDRNKNIASVRTMFVGDGSTAHCPQNIYGLFRIVPSNSF